MRVINFEDNVYKHVAICKILESCGVTDTDIVWVRNLEAGIDAVHAAIEAGEKFDLIITDMWYPAKEFGGDNESGDALIEKSKAEKWDIPIILLSTIKYYYPNILGALQYSELENWEHELEILIKSIK